MSDLSYVTDCCRECGTLNRPKTSTVAVDRVVTRYVCDCGYWWRTSWMEEFAREHDREMRRRLEA